MRNFRWFLVLATLASCTEAHAAPSNFAERPELQAPLEHPDLPNVNVEGTGFLPPGVYKKATPAQVKAASKAITSRSIVYAAGQRWPNPRAIPACWVNPDGHEEIVSNLQLWANQDYGRVGMGYDWKGKCSGDMLRQQMVKIYFRLSHTWNTTGGISAGAGLSYVGMVGPLVYLGGIEGPTATMNIHIAKDVGGFSPTTWRQWTIDATRGAFIHELGHNAGLQHEQERIDGPLCNDARGTLQNNGQNVYVGPFDPTSIMNYCKQGGAVASLSEGDLNGLRYLYPSLVNGGSSGGGGGGGGNSGGGNQPKGSYTIRVRATNKCLDIPSNGTANGLKLQQWDCNGSTAQSFLAESAGNGQWVLRGTNSKKCLDVPGSSRDDGARIQLYDCNGTNAQRFTLGDRGQGWVEIKNVNSGKCFDIDLKGGYLQQWTCYGETNKQFGFFTVGASAPIGMDIESRRD